MPLLDGLREVMALGIFSSLQPQNVRLRRAIANLDAAAIHPLYPALFDPQTAGGLLASVPAENANACIADLRSAGYLHAAVIGVVQAKSERLEPITIELGSDVSTEHALSKRGAELPREKNPKEVTRAHEPVL